MRHELTVQTFPEDIRDQVNGVGSAQSPDADQSWSAQKTIPQVRLHGSTTGWRGKILPGYPGDKKTYRVKLGFEIHLDRPDDHPQAGFSLAQGMFDLVITGHAAEHG
ncbi:MAG: hypothetical protein FD153_572 [Rhodospirillaceae bacterium]|nr:MAG: hypothetical protein FD153_572 [Rhodospirillaceae bacterium]